MLGGAACGRCYKKFKGKSDRDLGLYGMKTKYQETKMKRVLDAHLTTLSPTWKTCFYSICSYRPGFAIFIASTSPTQLHLDLIKDLMKDTVQLK